ncbi:hypothetical protein BpHYR1_039936 [Brachionus plicatilis]|uniref:Uncharacterized protein n=1 Tax=Brachionus plicatilis TaxID=10195 RepID=A0A3M7Q683_BRAPC|nr:hypothetical protein BpHYR1_039936 [Brachionus plicatilis]
MKKNGKKVQQSILQSEIVRATLVHGPIACLSLWCSIYVEKIISHTEINFKDDKEISVNVVHLGPVQHRKIKIFYIIRSIQILKMKFFLIFIFYLTFLLQNLSSSRNEKVVFNRVDFVIDYEIDDQIVQIEVFKASSNDQIIQSADSHFYDILSWFSMGYPKLVDFHRNSSIFNRFGFNINVEFLNNQIRDKICQMILQRYKIKVEPSQIVDVVPHRFKCEINLLDHKNKIHTIEGSGFKMRKSPFLVNFDVPLNTTKRILFEKYFYSNQDLIIQCYLEAESVELNPLNLKDLFHSKNINKVIGSIKQMNGRLNSNFDVSDYTRFSDRTIKFSSGVIKMTFEIEHYNYFASHVKKLGNYRTSFISI